MPTPQHLFKELSKDRQQNADVLEKQSMRGVKLRVIEKYSDSAHSMRGVKLRVIEKYSDSAHFIYELLQNADDVKATRARFVLTESGILFAHNGTIHFSVTAHDNEEIDTQNQRLGHINAITSIGNSNKYEAQIGKFGVGFKAVFQYSSTPEIYDPPF
jgi:HSP90 family molecular chaperone